MKRVNMARNDNMDYTAELFSQRLLIRMGEMDMSQKQLASLLGVHINTVGNWIYGKSEPGISMFSRLVIILRTTPDWLLGLEDIPWM